MTLGERQREWLEARMSEALQAERERHECAGAALDAYLEEHPGARTPEVLDALTPEPPFTREDLATVIGQRVQSDGPLVLGVDLSLTPREVEA